LAEVVGDARVVSLGEASHGTSEYFTLKHRFIRYLVEHLGFTEFSIEASLAGGRVVDEWVQGAGPDTPEAANIALAHTSYHTWDTVEVLEMIRWMRAYNQGRPESGRVHFHGFDVGGSSLAVQQYLEYLHAVDPQAVDAKLAELLPIIRLTYGVDYHFLGRALESAIAELDANREAYEAMSSRRQLAMTRLGLADARTAFQFIHTGAAGEWMIYRDITMAENCAGLLEAAGPDQKLIVWAHNGHVARHIMEIPANRGAPPPGGTENEPPELASVKSQGWHLAERFGADQRVIGFALGGGYVKMWDFLGDGALKDREFGPPPEDTVDAALAQLGEPLVAVDLRQPPADGTAGDWLRAARRSRSLTAGWFGEMSEWSFSRAWLGAFDVVVYVDKSTGVTYNPTVVMSRDETDGVTGAALEPANLDFAADTEGWLVTGGGDRPGAYQVSVREGVAAISRPDTGFRTGSGGVRQRIDATAYRGKRVTVTAEARTETESLWDQAYLVLACSGAVQTSDDAEADWSELSASIDVGEEATQLVLSLRLHGNGRAEFRNAGLTVEG